MKSYYYIPIFLFFAASCGVDANHTSDLPGVENTEHSLASSEPVKTPQITLNEIQTNWRSTVASNALEWNGNDLFVQVKKGRKQGMFSSIAENYCRAEQKGEERDCFCGHFIRLASIVGTIISIDHESNFSCQGSYLSWRYASFDLIKSGDFRYPTFADFNSGKMIKAVPGKLISLKALFPENTILFGLLANEEVSKEIALAIQEKRIASSPKTLDELNNHFAKFDSYLMKGIFLLEKDYLTRFAFHHLDGDKVAVWISLTPTAHVSHAIQEHIEILLPIPENLRQSLLKAETGTEGFLMKDSTKFVGTSYAEFEFK